MHRAILGTENSERIGTRSCGMYAPERKLKINYYNLSAQLIVIVLSMCECYKIFWVLVIGDQASSEVKAIP